ncbi:hypothetical protein B0H13DRAFT_42038 [Mycena leptocephala]|nr:hypothetical protein B0H13DRAFT_42038 [Mycena leptocephala]
MFLHSCHSCHSPQPVHLVKTIEVFLLAAHPWNHYAYRRRTRWSTAISMCCLIHRLPHRRTIRAALDQGTFHRAPSGESSSSVPRVIYAPRGQKRVREDEWHDSPRARASPGCYSRMGAPWTASATLLMPRRRWPILVRRTGPRSYSAHRIPRLRAAPRGKAPALRISVAAFAHDGRSLTAVHARPRCCHLGRWAWRRTRFLVSQEGCSVGVCCVDTRLSD